MQKNLDRLGGLIHSQRVLLALTQAGVSREDSYRLVQRNAMPVWRGEGDFLALLKADPGSPRRSRPSRSRRASISATTSSTWTRSSGGSSATAETPHDSCFDPRSRARVSGPAPNTGQLP